MEALIAAIISSGAPLAVLVLLVVVVAQFAVLRELHRAIREDRLAAGEKEDRLAAVITELRIEIARQRIHP